MMRTPGMRSFMWFRQRRSVLLPHPDGPMSAVTLFIGIFIPMSAMACLWPYQRLSSESSKIACPGGSIMGRATDVGAVASMGEDVSGSWMLSVNRVRTLTSVIAGPSSCDILAPEPFADDRRQEVEAEHRNHQHNDTSGGVLPEFFLGADRPVIDLDGDGREVVQQAAPAVEDGRAVVVERDESKRADHDQGGGLARRARHGQDYAGHDPGGGLGQDVVPDGLPMRGAQRQRPVADARGHLPDRLLGSDDGHRYDHQGQREGAGHDAGPHAEVTHED